MNSATAIAAGVSLPIVAAWGFPALLGTTAIMATLAAILSSSLCDIPRPEESSRFTVVRSRIETKVLAASNGMALQASSLTSPGRLSEARPWPPTGRWLTSASASDQLSQGRSLLLSATGESLSPPARPRSSGCVSSWPTRAFGSASELSRKDPVARRPLADARAEDVRSAG